MRYGTMHTYAENLAEGFRALSPTHLAGALNQRRLFFRYTRKALKKELMLRVMLGDEELRLSTVELLQQMVTGKPMVDSSGSRHRFLSERVAALHQLQEAYHQLGRSEPVSSSAMAVPTQRVTTLGVKDLARTSMV